VRWVQRWLDCFLEKGSALWVNDASFVSVKRILRNLVSILQNGVTGFSEG